MADTEKLVVFTDLDGTLLDHDTYSWAPAAEAIRLLRLHRVPLVIVTSKTCEEVFALRRELGNRHPFVVENGAATVVPVGYFKDAAAPGVMPQTLHMDGDEYALLRPGPGRSRLQELAYRLRDELDLDFTSFAELGPAGIAAATGLSPSAAIAANNRLASEPLLWRGDDEDYRRFEHAMHNVGANCVRGGRFVHALGGHDKVDAVRWLLSSYARMAGGPMTSVALGDAPNDEQMLALADIAVLVRTPGREPPLPGLHQRVLRPALPGPAGWAQAVIAILRGQSL